MELYQTYWLKLELPWYAELYNEELHLAETASEGLPSPNDKKISYQYHLQFMAQEICLLQCLRAAWTPKVIPAVVQLL